MNFTAFQLAIYFLATFYSGVTIAQNVTTIMEEISTTSTTTIDANDFNDTNQEADSIETTTTTPLYKDTSKISDVPVDQEKDKLKDLIRKKQVVVVEGEDDEVLKLPEGYTKEKIPASYEGKKPFKVAIFINIRAINSIDMLHEKITLDLDLYEFWADSRFHASLKDTSNTTKKSGKDAPFVVQVQKLDPEFVKKIWVPDLLIENTVLIPHNDLTSQPLVSFNSETGFVKYSRLEVTSPCAMSFFYYPLDTQTCEMTIRSYKHFSDHLNLHWVHSGVFLGSVDNPNFAIKVDSATKEKRVARTINLPNLLDKVHLGNIIFADNTFDVLKVSLKFRRNVSFHMAQTYMPSTFFIAITWLCFLLPASLAASRVGITMTTLLTINTMFNSVRQSAPQVSYAKAVDFWMGACTLFTFLSLLEFTVMAWLEHVKEREEKRTKEFEEEEHKALELCNSAKEKIVEDNDEKQGDGLVAVFSMPMTSTKDRKKIKRMDPDELKKILKIRKFLKKHGLTMLWMSFVIFNIIYWSWICAGSKYFDWDVDPSCNG